MLEPDDTTAPPSSGERSYHHGNLRTALVDEAFLALRRGGAGAVSLRGVAASVGVSPSAAYHHFPGKEALLRAVGAEVDRLFSRRLVDAATAVRGNDARAARDRFQALGRAYIAFAREEPNLFRHLFGPMCAPGPGGGGPVVSHGFAALLDSVEDLAGRGLLRDGVRDGLEVVAWSSVHGFAVLASEGFLPDSDEERLLSTLLAAVVDIPAGAATVSGRGGGRRAARPHRSAGAGA